MEIEIELESKPKENNQNVQTQPFIPFSINGFKENFKKSSLLQIGDKLIPKSKIKKVRKISHNSQNPEPDISLISNEANGNLIEVSLPNNRRNSYKVSKYKIKSTDDQSQVAAIAAKRKRIMTFDEVNNQSVNANANKQLASNFRKRSTNQSEIMKAQLGLEYSSYFGVDSAQ